MKTIHKFVLKSYLGPMILTFFIVMFVLMMNFMWRYIDDLVGKGLDLSVILELMMYASANMIPMGLPLATLLAAIMTMGNLGENYELLAMKSAGMSLPQIIKPLAIVVFVVAVGSFFVANNLVPYSNKKMFALLNDIKNQRQEFQFRDGVFTNLADDLIIRADRQDPQTHRLEGVLIYDTRARNGNMNTTVAQSGFIRLSDDKKFLTVTLFDGETYETTRNYQWNTKSTLRHNIFQRQDLMIPIDGFSFKRSGTDGYDNNVQALHITELQTGIDSLSIEAAKLSTRSYEPLLKGFIFTRDPSLRGILDSVETNFSGSMNILDSIDRMDMRSRRELLAKASSDASNSRSMLTFDEEVAKSTLNSLYRFKVEWHRKMSLPVSIMIFFLIGAPLGAIIRKGGLGMPIVVSVLFFVIYYIISIAGEKMAKEGTWGAFAGMWISTFILFPISMYLTWKATNDSNLFNAEWYIIHYNRFKGYIQKLRRRKAPKK